MKTEAKIQQEIVMWYRNNYCLKHHSPRGLIMSIPNEGKPDLVRTGLYPGASDLIVIFPSGKLIFLEVKTHKGIQSKNQKKFKDHVIESGFEYHLVRSFEDFIKQLQEAGFEVRVEKAEK